MIIGIKLDIGFEESDAYRRLYGDGDILEYLYGIGFRGTEVPVGLDTDEEQLIEHVRTCCQAGLRISIHPYSERTEANPAYFEDSSDNACLKLHKRFFQIAQMATELQDASAVVNIHPAAGESKFDRTFLIEQSQRFFTWTRQWCADHAPNVRPVAELQIRPNVDEDIQRIGDRYEELLQIVEGSGVEACWDFGHAYMNSLRFGDAMAPSKELLSRIGHVHCHDADNEDHCPLLFGKVPWESFLQRSIEGGFDGTVILEVSPERFLSSGGVDAVKQSLDKIRVCMGRD